jgi:hypothetical protein
VGSRRPLVTLSLFALASLAACSHRDAPDPNAALLASLRGLRDQVCACNDAVCADKVEETKRAWENTHIAELVHATPSPEQDKAATTMFDEIDACLVRARSVPTDLRALMIWTRDKTCACADYGCAMHASDELMTWVMNHPDERQRVEEMATIRNETDACAEKLRPKK